MRVRMLTLAEAERLAHALAREMMAWGEPIPPFETRYPERLEACLAVPFQTYAAKPLYDGLVAQASILFYLLVKNHPFQNGNKRIAVTALLVFLHLNAKWIAVDPIELYHFAALVAGSPAKQKDQYLEIVRTFVKSNLTDRNA